MMSGHNEWPKLNVPKSVPGAAQSDTEPCSYQPKAEVLNLSPKSEYQKVVRSL